MLTFLLILSLVVVAFVSFALYRGWLSPNKNKFKQDAKQVIDKI